MRICMKAFLILLALGLMARPVSAQVDLTDDRTEVQKWNRAAFLMDGNLHGALSYVKSTGQTAEDYGRFLGEWAGVTLDEFRTVFFLIYEGVANYHGFDMTHEVDGDWVSFTVKTR